MSDDIYLELAEFLNGLPGGFPKTDSGAELKILRRLFLPEEAEMAMQLRLFPEPPSVIAKRVGMEETEAAEMLESMAKKGLIMRTRGGGNSVFYQALQFVVGIYEFHVNSIDKELSELMEELIPYVDDRAFKQFRVVPVHSAVDTTPSVASYDRIKDLVRKYDEIAVAPCICRLEQGHMGNECERPHETCLTFGIGAQLYVENGIGRKIDQEEALDILDQAEEAALVLQAANAKDIVNICCCCSCCCGILRGMKLQDRPADHVSTPFQARIDPELCTSCGTCEERCQMEAIVENEDAMKVDLARCIGCGLCISTCPEEAVSLVPLADKKRVPANYFDTLTMIAKDRGLGFGNLNPVMRVTKLPLFLKVLPYMYKTGLVKPVVNQLAKRGWV